MNKYKIVSLLLGFALLATLARLVYVSQGEQAAPAAESKSAVVLENILNRKSVRSYTDRAVSREQLDTLLRAAMAAPTGRDMRPWKFVVVDDKETLAKLAEALPRHKMLPEAQAAIAICGGKDGIITGPFPPCGVCRQVMREFCRDDFLIYLVGANGSIQPVPLAEMLPHSFSAQAHMQ